MTTPSEKEKTPDRKEGKEPIKQVQNENIKKYIYTQDGDNNGILYALLKGDHKSCEDRGVFVSSSSVSVGEVVDFIGRDKLRCWTQNIPYSWYCVDFGPDRLITPTHYSFGYGSSGNACLPRFWILQASKKITNEEPQYSSTDLPQNDPEWQTLSIHNNDTSINTEWGLHTWKLNCREAFRYFRIVQTGPNIYNSNGSDDNWSQVLVANRFEIYGILYSNPSTFPSTPMKVNPITYGNGGTIPKFTAPLLVRAEPSITQEIQVNFIEI